MDTRKFEYLETIRETIEMADYEELDDYVEDIRDQVKGDPQFEELFGEIKSKNYGDVISLIDEFIYQDIQSESDEFFSEDALQKMSSVDSGLDSGLLPVSDFPEEITFEEFNENAFSSEIAGEEE
jgi:hypothetical protein